ncbi:sphingosine kinase [Massilia forsythiae]|uniref:Sphingosine kinase n=1 Tax=Massilia forsythiae TaxID=2728020 RepID=A0A7Z2W1F0_9BURK|nr:diacylglycerol kinase family protein [Massilia forsythiae]QJE03018.1 sphingosine kinase [Massilia forsythiae]
MNFAASPHCAPGCKPVSVIVNAGAGSGHDEAGAVELRALLQAAGLDAEVTMAAGGAELVAAARRACQDGARLVVAGGGDGSINAVASQLLADDTPSGIRFGVLPLGTLNHFAKDLGIPLDLEGAIRTLATGEPARVDVGEVNGRVFLNNSSLGLYPDIVRDREKQQRRLGRGKWPAALWATLAALRRYPFLSMRLEVDGARLARRSPFVFIGNNAYTMQGLAIGARERLDAGLLSLYVAQRPTRLGLLRLALDALRGRLGGSRDVDVLHAAAFEIDTHRARLHVATDGEVTIMAPPLRYRSRPGALEVMVPRRGAP